MTEKEANSRTTMLLNNWERERQEVIRLNRAMDDAEERRDAAAHVLATHLAPKDIRVGETIGIWLGNRVFCVTRTTGQWRVDIRGVNPDPEEQ